MYKINHNKTIEIVNFLLERYCSLGYPVDIKETTKVLSLTKNDVLISGVCIDKATDGRIFPYTVMDNFLEELMCGESCCSVGRFVGNSKMTFKDIIFFWSYIHQFMLSEGVTRLLSTATEKHAKHYSSLLNWEVYSSPIYVPEYRVRAHLLKYDLKQF